MVSLQEESASASRSPPEASQIAELLLWTCSTPDRGARRKDSRSEVAVYEPELLFVGGEGGIGLGSLSHGERAASETEAEGELKRRRGVALKTKERLSAPVQGHARPKIDQVPEGEQFACSRCVAASRKDASSTGPTVAPYALGSAG